MTVAIDSSGTAEALEALLRTTASREGVQGLLVFTCAANGYTASSLDPVLRAQTLPLIGGIFPAVLADGKKLERGSVVVGLNVPVRTLTIVDLDGDGEEDPQKLQTTFAAGIDAGMGAGSREDAVIRDQASTVIVMLDAFAAGIDEFLKALFSVLGLERTYLGGGAGTLDMDGTPSLLSNRGLVGRSALVMLLDTDSSLGVSHGWTPVAGPYRVTRSRGPEVCALDWNNAFSVYREVIREAGGPEIREETFFEVAREYPFGISRMENELVVRDPFAVGPDGSLTCIGAVPQGSFIHILHGDEQSLIAAAADARLMCEANWNKTGERDSDTACLRIFFDCISRVLFLGNRFSEELDAVYDSSRPLVGACSIGEVANSGDSYLEFYNKTAVVADLQCEQC